MPRLTPLASAVKPAPSARIRPRNHSGQNASRDATPSAAPAAPRSRYRMALADSALLGVVPLVDVLLVLLVLLILLVASAGQGDLRSVPLEIPAVSLPASEAPVVATPEVHLLTITAEGVQIRTPGDPALRPLVLPHPDARPLAQEMQVYCLQAGLTGVGSVQVAAHPASVHSQLAAVMGFAQQCGVRDMQLVLKAK